MFEDFFSTTKGAGVLGVLLGSLVLVGLGGLVLAGSDRNNASPLMGKIRELQVDILDLKTRERDLERQVREGKEMNDKFLRVEKGLQEEMSNIDKLEARIVEAKAAIAHLESQWERYLMKVRENMVGRMIAKLTLADERVFEEVEIKRVTPLHMTFSHKDGVSRVNVELLPREMLDELRYTEAEKLEWRKKMGEEERLRDLYLQLQQWREMIANCESAIRNHQHRIQMNENEKAGNTPEIRELDARARTERGSERGRDAKKRATALRTRNRDLDNENRDLRQEIPIHREKIAAAKGKIEDIEAKLGSTRRSSK